METKDLLERAKAEIREEIKAKTVKELKERLYEIRETRSILKTLEAQLEAKLREEIDLTEME